MQYMHDSIARPRGTRYRSLSDYAPKHCATGGRKLTGTRYNLATPVVRSTFTPTRTAATPDRIRENTWRRDGLGAHSDVRARLYA